jgi:hypothetical protein
MGHADSQASRPAPPTRKELMEQRDKDAVRLRQRWAEAKLEKEIRIQETKEYANRRISERSSKTR